MYGKVGAKEINVEKVVNQTKVKVYFDRGVGFSERDVTETIADFHNDSMEVNIEIPSDVCAVRFDPLENQYCCVRLLEVTDEQGRDVQEHIKSNGVFHHGTWYFLDVSDPWFVISNSVKKLHIRYHLTIVREEDCTAYANELKYIQKRSNSKIRKCARGIRKVLHITK